VPCQRLHLRLHAGNVRIFFFFWLPGVGVGVGVGWVNPRSFGFRQFSHCSYTH
jgi:hypothetical protein